MQAANRHLSGHSIQLRPANVKAVPSSAQRWRVTQHYSVQWNEADLDYLLRRFEEDGLFYSFRHEDGSHKLHVADSANGLAWTISFRLR